MFSMKYRAEEIGIKWRILSAEIDNIITEMYCLGAMR